MNVSHLHIKFTAIEKRPFRPHFPMRTCGPGAEASVGSPEITPQPGAFKHVGIRHGSVAPCVRSFWIIPFAHRSDL